MLRLGIRAGARCPVPLEPLTLQGLNQVADFSFFRDSSPMSGQPEAFMASGPHDIVSSADGTVLSGTKCTRRRIERRRSSSACASIPKPRSPSESGTNSVMMVLPKQQCDLPRGGCLAAALRQRAQRRRGRLRRDWRRIDRRQQPKKRESSRGGMLRRRHEKRGAAGLA